MHLRVVFKFERDSFSGSKICFIRRKSPEKQVYLQAVAAPLRRGLDCQFLNKGYSDRDLKGPIPGVHPEGSNIR